MVVQIDHRDKTLESQMTVVNDKCIEGFRRSEAWAKDQHIYFVIEFSEPFSNDIGIGKRNNDGKETISNYQLDFGQLHGKSIYIKVGISIRKLTRRACSLRRGRRCDTIRRCDTALFRAQPP